MNLIKIIIFCFFFHLFLCQNLRVNSLNQIVNGNFQNPAFTGTQLITSQTLFGWNERSKNQYRLVKASMYNSMYPSSAQALAINQKIRVYQMRTLFQKQWELTFSVGLAVNSLMSTYNFTSHLKVYWNDQMILDLNPTTPSIQYIKTRVKSINGSNVIQFAGNEDYDCDLIDVLVDDVSLVQVVNFKGQEVYAGLSGAGRVQFSNYHIGYDAGRCYLHNNYLLDYYFPGQPGIWTPQTNTYGQWAQIGTDQIRQWIAVVTQGRNDDYSKGTQYVRKYKVSYTINGIDWIWVQNGRIFDGNLQGIIKQRANFAEPILATSLKIYPVEWQSAISMRFDAIFKM